MNWICHTGTKNLKSTFSLFLLFLSIDNIFMNTQNMCVRTSLHKDTRTPGTHRKLCCWHFVGKWVKRRWRKFNLKVLIIHEQKLFKLFTEITENCIQWYDRYSFSCHLVLVSHYLVWILEPQTRTVQCSSRSEIENFRTNAYSDQKQWF